MTPKIIATSVVRGSQKGQSHGGVYLIDFTSQEVAQKIDWNTGEIDFSGRGWDRGLRGIAFCKDFIWIAASDELFCYSPEFELIGSYRNQYLRHCHEICRKDHLLFITSTGFDSILAFDLNIKEYIWGLYIARDGSRWTGQRFDPRTRSGPPLTNAYHLNMVNVNNDGITCSGLNTGALLAISSEMEISEFCTLPRGCHNAMPYADGVLFNDTGSDVVRYVPRSSREIKVPVPIFPQDELLYRGVDDSRIARQGFGRGLCVIDNHLIAAGSSPSTISIIDIKVGVRISSVTLTMDIRNAIHGLEPWPKAWN